MRTDCWDGAAQPGANIRTLNRNLAGLQQRHVIDHAAIAAVDRVHAVVHGDEIHDVLASVPNRQRLREHLAIDHR